MLHKVLSRLGLGDVDLSKILWVGVDISKRKHSACMGTRDRVFCRHVRFTNTRDGLEHFVAAIRRVQRESQASVVIIGMEPTSVYWKPLNAQLRRLGYATVLADAKAVKHNRQTLGGNASKSDKKDAFAIYDLLRQGKCLLPVEREPALESAHRLMQHYEDSRHRSGQIRNQLRASLSLVFPELNELIKKLDGKTAQAFLIKNPTPGSIRRLEREAFLERWRGRHGQWGRRWFDQLYELAGRSIGVADPQQSFEFEIRLLTEEFQRALAIQEQWFQRALSLIEAREDFQLVVDIPGIGDKLAVGLLSCLGRPGDFRAGKQWVSLAGLDLKFCDSGESVHKVPRISRRGKALLRCWLYQGALHVVRYEGPFQQVYERRQANSPGRGAKKRALIAVCDKLVRVIFAMVRDHRAYDRHHDQQVEVLYQPRKKAA